MGDESGLRNSYKFSGSRVRFWAELAGSSRGLGILEEVVPGWEVVLKAAQF
jgi:hypothetical protein